VSNVRRSGSVIIGILKLAPASVRAAAVVAAAAVAGAPAPPARAACGPPTLTILSPHDGETVQAPLEVRYRIRCFRVGSPPSGHLHVWVGARRRLELYPRRQAGSVGLSSPLLSGRLTLTFQLARASHAPVRNREARVVVSDLVFEGP
jgi:hypothetical protein